LANEWGNLVNRSVSMAFKNCGQIPAAGELTDDDTELLEASRGAFETVGELLGHAKFKAAITEAMRIVGLANAYISAQEPWKLKDDPARRDTVLHVALQVVSDCNTLLTPFLPHASQQVYQALGGEGIWAAMPEMVEVEENGRSYPVLQGDYAAEKAHWASEPIAVGRPLSKPSPIVHKIDPKLAETGPEWAPISTD
ncbi:MAG: class I tRNA ligase family protein, partial [Acidipropionibacterium jensenii]|nr:class I tRNA ligase family protein [Acidipropionibacterium jensenii]